MKVREFISRERITILILSWIVAGVLILIASRVSPDDAWLQALLINLSSASFATGFTVTLIDFLITKERYLSFSEGRELGNEEIRTLVWNVSSSLARLFGFDFNKITFEKRRKTHDERDTDYLFNTVNDALKAHLNQMVDRQDTKEVIMNSQRDELKESLNKSMIGTDSLLNRYGYALTNRQKAGLLRLRKNVNSVVSMMDLSLLSVDRDGGSAFKSVVVYLYEQIRKDFPDELLPQNTYKESSNRKK